MSKVVLCTINNNNNNDGNNNENNNNNLNENTVETYSFPTIYR